MTILYIITAFLLGCYVGGQLVAWHIKSEFKKIDEECETGMSHTYKCSMCGGTFDSGWSEEEAVAEKERDFGNVPLDACRVVCDDCYQEVRPDQHPEQLASFRNLT